MTQQPVARKSVTLLDVARVAGVSKTTASHALNGKGWVAPATRETVLRTAQEMGFVADPLAQRLSNGRCHNTVGYFTLDIDLSGRTRQMQLIHAALSDLGYSVPIYAYGYRGSGKVEDQKALMSALVAQRPRAIVCNTAGVQPEAFEALRRFQDEGGVVVCYCYGRSVEVPCDQVVYDEETSAYLAAMHLLELGHRHIGLFNVGERRPSGANLKGFTRALEEFGVPLHEEWLFRNEGVLRYEEEGEVLAKQILTMKKRPTALCLANDYAAVAFINTLQRAGVLVPRDMSVVGDDNDPIAAHGVVPLTTVHYPLEEIAQHVIDLLESRLNESYTEAARRVNVNGHLVMRESTAVPPKSKPRKKARLRDEVGQLNSALDLGTQDGLTKKVSKK
jgi:DNA-binding LacI/PurR family transcriptional regulator